MVSISFNCILIDKYFVSGWKSQTKFLFSSQRENILEPLFCGVFVEIKNSVSGAAPMDPMKYIKRDIRGT